MENQNTPVDDRLSPMWMPQVTAPLEYVKEQLDKMKVGYKKINVDPNHLVALQDKIDRTKAETLLREIDNNAPVGPIFISGDNEILDGHHRAYAFKHHPHVSSAECIKLYMDYRDAARVLNQIQDRYNFELEMNGGDNNGNLISFNEPLSVSPTASFNSAMHQATPVSATVDTGMGDGQHILEPQVVEQAPVEAEQAPVEAENPNIVDCTGMHPDFVTLLKKIKQHHGMGNGGEEPSTEVMGGNDGIPEELPLTSEDEPIAPENTENAPEEVEAPQNSKSLKLFKTKNTLNQTAKTGDFLLLAKMKEGVSFEFEIDFDNLLEIAKEDCDSLEFPTMAVLSKLGYTGDTKVESNKLGLTREVFISRKANELAFNRGFDGIQYGEDFVQIINKPF
jgi:hypothetical protein